MSESPISRTHPGLMARSAIWLTCPDCGHTSRVLAVMASRVLQLRRECPECLSAAAPLLQQTQPGAHISAEEVKASEHSEGEQARLHAWIESESRKGAVQHWLRMILSRLAARFSRTKPVAAKTSSDESVDEADLGLTPTEHDVL